MASNGPARRGRRVQLQDAPVATAEVAGASLYVCTVRPLRYGDDVLTEGVEVPGAADWVRIEAWINARRIKKISADDVYIPYADFKAKIDQAHFDEAEPGE